jgi:hypothetical protein
MIVVVIVVVVVVIVVVVVVLWLLLWLWLFLMYCTVSFVATHCANLNVYIASGVCVCALSGLGKTKRCLNNLLLVIFLTKIMFKHV